MSQSRANLVPGQIGNLLKHKADPFVLAIGTRLSMGVEPASILLQGDSTANAPNEWFYQAMQWLAGRYPAYTFTQRLWNDATQSYDGATPIQTGVAGDAYATLPGIAGSYLSTLDKATLDITGDIDIRIKVALNTWISGSGEQALISKFGTGAARAWRFGINGANGRTYLQWSADGTALLGGVGSYAQAAAAPTVANGNPIWLRVTLDVDNGAGGHTIKFLTSPDGVTWTQLGPECVGGGITSVFTNNDALEIGSRGNGAADFWAGKVYTAELRNGINGKSVLSPDFDMVFPAGKTTFNDLEGNVWAINGTATAANGSPGVLILNASTSGQVIGYSTNAARFDLQTPLEPVLAFISYSHNEGATTAYQSAYESLASQIRTKYPNAGIVCVTQNPRKAPAINNVPHAQRCQQIATLAAKNQYGLVDAYRAFMQTGNHDSLIDPDGIHPTQAGSDLWRDVAIDFLRPATFFN